MIALGPILLGTFNACSDRWLDQNVLVKTSSETTVIAVKLTLMLFGRPKRFIDLSEASCKVSWFTILG